MEQAVKMLAFAGARDVIGAGELDLPLGGPCTAAELMDVVCARFPGLTPYRGSLRIAINGVYADASDPVRSGDEVALIPPVAGG
jgi:molybdopterin converting factor small subunit